jgi:hypothetical protein
LVSANPCGLARLFLLGRLKVNFFLQKLGGGRFNASRGGQEAETVAHMAQPFEIAAVD